MIEAIILDFGNVLYKEEWKLVMNELQKNYKVSFPEFYLSFQNFWENYEIGKRGIGEFWGDVLNDLKIPATGENMRAFSSAFKNVWHKANEPLLELLSRKKEKCRIYGLTNSCIELEEKLQEDADKLKMFEKIYMSHKEGRKKPDDEAYLTLVYENGLKPENCLFVDDKERNTEAAKKLGFKVHTYRGMDNFAKEINSYGI
jgi:HAD superfamily hydrolase (TIGR01509 family)